MDPPGQLERKPALTPFAGFVSGPEHREALAALVRVTNAVEAGRVTDDLNPLFLYGPSGSGKSHLVAGLAAEVQALNARFRTRVLIERPASEPAESAGGSQGLEDALRGNLVVIEDIHRWVRRRGEQPWFRTLVDEARARRRALVITSREPPTRLPPMSAGLSGRLAQGLVARLPPPGPTTRVGLLAQYLETAGLSVSDRVRDWLAPQLPSSGRAIQSVVNRLATLAARHGPAIDPGRLAALWDQPASADVVLGGLVDRVGRRFHVSPRSVRGGSRNRILVLARQVSMYLAREQTTLSLGAIGRYFGNRDHTTVLYSCRKIREAVGSDGELAAIIRDLNVPDETAGRE